MLKPELNTSTQPVKEENLTGNKLKSRKIYRHDYFNSVFKDFNNQQSH